MRRLGEFLQLPEATPLQQVPASLPKEQQPREHNKREAHGSSDSVFQPLENIDEDEEDCDDGDKEGINHEEDNCKKIAGTEEVSALGDEPAAVVIRNGEFSWDEDRADQGLKGISVRIPKGKLTVIVGSIGSGKSSLICSLLGEMRQVSGEVLWTR